MAVVLPASHSSAVNELEATAAKRPAPAPRFPTPSASFGLSDQERSFARSTQRRYDAPSHGRVHQDNDREAYFHTRSGSLYGPWLHRPFTDQTFLVNDRQWTSIALVSSAQAFHKHTWQKQNKNKMAHGVMIYIKWTQDIWSSQKLSQEHPIMICLFT